MLNIEAKYEQLKLMLSTNYWGYSEFEDDIVGKYFIVDTKRANFTISVYVSYSEQTLQIYLEEKIEDEWEPIERKQYKTPKGAFNKIMKLLNY